MKNVFTPAQHTARIIEISAIQESSIRNSPVKDLRQLLNGLVGNYTKMNKVQLIETILTLTSESREQLKLEKEKEISDRLAENALIIQSQNTTDKPTVELAVAYDSNGYETKDSRTPEKLGILWYEELKAGLESKSFEHIVSSLSTEILFKETSWYPNICTRRTRRTTYIDQMKRYAAIEGSDSKMLRAIESIHDILKAEWKNEVVAHHAVYMSDLSNPDIKREILDEDLVKQLTSDSVEVLSNLENHTWQQIAIALGFATGRRTSEIMCTASFKFVDEYQISFTGQTKERGDLNNKTERLTHEYIIPTIVKAQLVVDGLAYLSQMTYTAGKRAGRPIRTPLNLNDPTASTKQSHAEHGKPLSRAMDKYQALTFKDLRKFYCITCYYLYETETTRVIPYYGKLLCHDTELGVTAAQSYDKYYLTPTMVEDLRMMR